MDEFLRIVPAGIVVGMAAVLMVVLYSIRWYERRRAQPAIRSGLQSSPGQSLRTQMERLNDEIQTYLVYAIAFPWLVYALHISTSYFRRTPESGARSAFSIALAVLVCGLFLYRLLRLIDRRQKLRLNHEGVLTVGQQLSLLIQEGFKIFHDFPADGTHIDHIVVGPGGIFAIQTLTVAPPQSTHRTVSAVVMADGHRLVFPHGEDHDTMVQAQGQAKWLNQWLEQAIGESMPVKPLVILPGWEIEHKGSNGVAVLNPKGILSLVRPRNGHPLPERLIRRVGQQLNHRYRQIREGQVAPPP